MLAAIDAACEHGMRHQRDRDEGQAQLFGFGDERQGTGDNGDLAVPLLAVTPWTETEQLAYEKETLGLYWSGHPVDPFAQDLKALGARLTTELADQQTTGSRSDGWGPGGPKPIEPDTTVGGIVAACRQLKTRKGDRMAVFTLEDALGGVEVIAFPDTYQRAAASLIEDGQRMVVSSAESSSATTKRFESSPLRSSRSRWCANVSRAKWPSG